VRWLGPAQGSIIGLLGPIPISSGEWCRADGGVGEWLVKANNEQEGLTSILGRDTGIVFQRGGKPNLSSFCEWHQAAEWIGEGIGERQ
jgi:hypothetical protein